MPVRRPVKLSIDTGSTSTKQTRFCSRTLPSLTPTTTRAYGREPCPSLITLARERSQWNALCKHFVAERVSAADATEAHFRKFFAKPERMENHIRNHVSYLRLFDNVMRANAH